MNSPEISILPVPPDELVESAYQRARSEPRGFVMETVRGLADDRSYLLHSYLVDALRFSGELRGEYDVLCYLRQVLFVPFCLEKTSHLQGSPSTRVARATMESLYRELAGIGEKERFRRDLELEERVGRHSPLLANHLDSLHNLGTQEQVPAAVLLQARRKSYRAFELYERQALDPTPSSPRIDYGQGREEKPTDSIPLIRSSIVDMALLRIGLNQYAFGEDVLNQLKVTNELMIAFFSVARGLLNLRSYALVASLISHGFSEEFNLRGHPHPVIARQLLEMETREAIDRITKSNKPLREVAESELTEARELLHTENPALAYGIDLIERVLKLDRVGVNNAVYNFYRAYRSQVDAEYWERKLTTE